MAKEQSQVLPGMEHRSIKALEDLAAAFVERKDARKRLKEQEDAIASKILALMRKHQKDHYKHDGIEIYIETVAEKVKVRVREEASEEEREEEDPSRA